MTAPVIDLSRAVSLRCRRVKTGETLYESSSPAVLRLLARHLRLKPPHGAICMCRGTIVFEVVGGVPSVITLHHGTSVRWPGSPGDVDLEDPDKMMDFLADHGMSFVRDEHRAGLERDARAAEAEVRWRARAPRSLRDHPDLTASFPSQELLSAWATALAHEHPDPVVRARALLTWYGEGESGFRSHTAYEIVPRDLLATLPDDVILEAIEIASRRESYGALRFLVDGTRKRQESLVRRLPADTLPRLEQEASVLLDDGDRGVLELMHASLAKRAASRIPPALRAPLSRPPGDARDLVSLPVAMIVRPGASAAGIDAAMRELHEQLLAFLHTYAYATDVWRNYVSPRSRVAGVLRTAAGFEFPDVGRPRSQTIAARWFRIALAAASSIEPALSQLGYHLAGVPRLLDVLDEPRVPLLLARDRLWLLTGTFEAPRIVGDAEDLEPTGSERARAAVLLASGLTEDPVENMLLPSASYDASLVAWLRTPGRHLSSTLRIASHCALPSDALTDALVASVAQVDVEEVLRAADRLGARAPAITPTAALTSGDPRVRAAALMALAGVARQLPARAPGLVDLLLAGMSRSPVERRVAAEQLGYIASHDVERATAALLGLLENAHVDDDCIEYAIMSLANLHRTDVPEPVVLAVGRVTTRPTRAGSLARWFLERNWPESSSREPSDGAC